MSNPTQLRKKRFDRQQKDIQLKIAYFGSALALGGVLVLAYKNRKITHNIDALFDIAESIVDGNEATLNVLELMHNTN